MIEPSDCEHQVTQPAPCESTGTRNNRSQPASVTVGFLARRGFVANPPDARSGVSVGPDAPTQTLCRRSRPRQSDPVIKPTRTMAYSKRTALPIALRRTHPAAVLARVRVAGRSG